jgi:hypothetical protein
MPPKLINQWMKHNRSVPFFARYQEPFPHEKPRMSSDLRSLADKEIDGVMR